MNASPENRSRGERSADASAAVNSNGWGVFAGVGAALLVVTLAVYWPVRGFDYVHYDDDEYVTDNTLVQAGITREGIKWAFTTGYASNWHPLTWLSHMLDFTLFGDRPGWHHFVNVLFHAANTLLLFMVFNRMTKAIWPSAFVAALFALHPLHVESVAWIAERKDVLSTLFWLLTMVAYVYYTERPGVLRYLIAAILLALGLMAKPMLVTLPFALLLLDYWPLNRFGKPGHSLFILVLEKLPLMAMAGVSSAVTFIVQQRGGAVLTVTSLSLRDRVANAFVSYTAYIGKMLWPDNLAPLYPHPVDGIATAAAIVCALALAAATAAALYYSKRLKYLAVGWLWYLGTLVPVIGIVQVGAQAYADRYTYITLTGIFVMAAFGAADIAERLRLQKAIIASSAAIILALLAIVTRMQLSHWKDSGSLFEHTLAVTKDNYIMHNNYGNILNDMGRPAEAASHFFQALRFMPNSPEVHNNLANALSKLGRTDEAIEHFNIALKLEPDLWHTHYNLAATLAKIGRLDEALEHYRIYIGPEIDASVANCDPATISAARPGLPGTMEKYRQMLTAKPYLVTAISDLGYAIASRRQPEDALRYYCKALEIDPGDILTHGRLALTLAELGRIDEAIEQCRIVLEARPDDAEMHCNLGVLLEQKGRLDEAIASYRKALEIAPGFSKARDYLNAALTSKPNR